MGLDTKETSIMKRYPIEIRILDKDVLRHHAGSRGQSHHAEGH